MKFFKRTNLEYLPFQFLKHTLNPWNQLDIAVQTDEETSKI